MSFPPEPGPTIVDVTVLNRLRKIGGDELVRKMIELFSTHGRLRVQAAQEAWERRDLREVERAAHSLRSSAGNVGAMILERLCAKLEKEASETIESQALGSLLSAVSESFSQALQVLQQESQ
ncbi:MAG: Hpt domain-containing protein [Acidobacteria bacterium]|nr:Hpt domain-containing protein [Acidobacteriota bacterium]